jgi:hypothetical protein
MPAKAGIHDFADRTKEVMDIGLPRHDAGAVHRRGFIQGELAAGPWPTRNDIRGPGTKR